MTNTSNLTIELLSMFRWETSEWKSPVSLMSPDATISLNVNESFTNNKWTANVSLSSTEFHNDLVLPELSDKIVRAVIERCKKDIKIIQVFGESLRKNSVKRNKMQSNMFAETSYRVNLDHRYRFIVALDGTSMDNINGIYLVPSYLPSPVDGHYDSSPFYKMSCYERFN